MNNWSAEAWSRVVDSAPEGIVVCDATVPDHPVIYANAAFAQMCGYPVTALLGTNLRMLQGTDKDQEARQRLREAVEKGEPALLVALASDHSTVSYTHLDVYKRQGYHRDASDRLRSSAERLTNGLPPWLREDRLTGLHSRAYFEELLQRDWMLAQRDSHEIGLTLFDIDDLGSYNETFEKTGGDACIRRVARVIGASYRRGGDLVGRWDGGTFAVLTQGDAAEKASHYAQIVSQRVRDLLMHHPRAGSERYVTVSAGVASLVPPRELPLEALLKATQAALKRSKKLGKNSISTAEAADFH